MKDKGKGPMKDKGQGPTTNHKPQVTNQVGKTNLNV
jgi:hypothetical protein